MTKKKKSKTKGRKLSSKHLKSEILKLFKRHPKKRFNPKQVSKKLKVANDNDSINHSMEQLAQDNLLIPMGDFKFKLKRDGAPDSEKSYHEGTVDMTRTGSAYILVDGLENDVHISAKNINNAMNGDRVKIRVWTPRGRRKPEGEVVKVLNRLTEIFMGTYHSNGKAGYVSIDNRTPMDIKIKPENSKDAKDGEKVVAKVLKWPNQKYPDAIGEITTVLGQPGSSDIEMKGILINNGFDLLFPNEVIAEAEALATEISEEEISKRLDLREIDTFTIDPETAQDFDDALSIRYLEDDRVEIGVHIADVTHYVQENTALDKEAYERSTSVYLVDRVLPMLPENLSNNLCSLRPMEDKLTFSAMFVFNKNNKVEERWFGKTIIHSNRRFTYEEAQERLDSKKGEFSEELLVMNKIAKILRKRRFKEGSINFETDEVKFRLDEEGVPVEVYVKERKEAHMLIEDFMLLANREVAAYMAEKGQHEEIPYIYRIHDEPDPDKVFQLAAFAQEMGFDMKIRSPEDIAKSYNKLADAVEKNPGLKVLEPLAIRTMAKAEYSTDNIGHYGLGFQFYSHFTSPIRRYSDVIAHRLLEKNLGSGNTHRTNKLHLEEKCQHISNQERRAMEAERESIKYKQVEFIEKHVGEDFEGIISGIGEYGLYVELLSNRCEGMVRFEDMNDRYEVADNRLHVKNMRTGHNLKMGDKIIVKIVRADLSKRQIDMAMVNEAP